MEINFNSFVEYNTKYPDNRVPVLYFILLNLAISEDVGDNEIQEFLFGIDTFDHNYKGYYKQLEEWDFIKITGNGMKDVSLRPLGIELIGEPEIDDITKLATKMREVFPPGVRSGGLLVRSSVRDISEKLRKFTKKHRYSSAEILQATKQYVERKRLENWAYMSRLVYFIEKDNASILADECEELSESSDNVLGTDTVRRL